MKILIDNGHGRETPGKRSPDGKLREYAYNRSLPAGLSNACRPLASMPNSSFLSRRTFPYPSVAAA